MSATLAVEIDPVIPTNAPLNDAVASATNYMKHLLDKYPQVRSDDRSLAWKHVAVPGEEPAVSATFEEHDAYGKRILTHTIRLRLMLDPVVQRVEMQELLRGVIHQRSQQISNRMDRYFQEMADEGANGQSD
ncbi:hypothetical protein [Limnoglobus roseus]|uniref:Uncharacterized protein n=1 Tax=Limnoglobus roseus TaxID=2598579 RepID=A0A5C1AC61_9BACT|nr:hypothetical protein [Limnoglobus roseus]QEL14674.1 hypothetical protein PX52LOC_01567 [Limnoglobus roseus]